MRRHRSKKDNRQSSLILLGRFKRLQLRSKLPSKLQSKQKPSSFAESKRKPSIF